MTKEEAIYILRNTAFLAPSLEPIDEAIEMACEALRKTENSSEKPNNCDTCKHNKLEWFSEVCDGCSKAHSNYEPKDEPFDKDINVRSKDEPHIVGKHADVIIIDDSRLTAKCLNCANGSSYKCSKCDGEMYYKYDKDEGQTETEIAKTIVHKMIDDAVIAEDAYPDLRQKMHDAVDEYEPQTERSE